MVKILLVKLKKLHNSANFKSKLWHCKTETKFEQYTDNGILQLATNTLCCFSFGNFFCSLIVFCLLSPVGSRFDAVWGRRLSSFFLGGVMIRTWRMFLWGGMSKNWWIRLFDSRKHFSVVLRPYILKFSQPL